MKQIILDDCVARMAEMEESSVDAVVCDPPYGLKFMGKEFDDLGHGEQQEVWHKKWFAQAFRVLKPGGHLLAFGGARTYHRLAAAAEDVGFEIRDQIMWIYGSGFPKSLDVSKAIDKAAGVEREVVGTYTARGFSETSPTGDGRNQWAAGEVVNKEGRRTVPTTDEAKQWDGWGTALKPAHEPCVLARKPFKGTVANNVLEHGVGGINIDECRVEGAYSSVTKPNGGKTTLGYMNDDGWQPTKEDFPANIKGRFPANIILTHHPECEYSDTKVEDWKCHPDCPVRMMDGQSGVLKSGKLEPYHKRKSKERTTYSAHSTSNTTDVSTGGTSGGASRFFYCAKASKKERTCAKTVENKHPTVKPLALMRYLCRLVTPPNGIVLDPFAGSGSTCIAAMQEGFNFIGIEKEEEYYNIAEQRIQYFYEEMQRPKEEKKKRA